MEKYVIMRKDRPGQMLKGLGIGSCNPLYPDQWTKYQQVALHFSQDEACATIDFITEVLDDYLGQQLYIQKIN